VAFAFAATGTPKTFQVSIELFLRASVVHIFGQRVTVQHGLPLRLVGAIASQRFAAAETTNVLLVGRETIDAVAADYWCRTAILRHQESQRFLPEGVIARILRQRGFGLLVLLLHPVEGALAIDLFQRQDFIAILPSLPRESSVGRDDRRRRAYILFRHAGGSSFAGHARQQDSGQKSLSSGPVG
jgi:hypothetical protein